VGETSLLSHQANACNGGGYGLLQSAAAAAAAAAADTFDSAVKQQVLLHSKLRIQHVMLRTIS